LGKVLIIYSSSGNNIKQIARGIKDGLEENGHRVDLRGTGETNKPVVFGVYDLVLVGSPTKGLFRGRPAKDIAPFLQNCKRTMGEKTIAFVTSRLVGTTGALKKIMEQMEKMGCFVYNFTSLKNFEEAVSFGREIRLD